MIDTRRIIYLCLVVSLSVLLSSCVTAPITPTPYPTQEVYPHISGPIIRSNIFHVVAPGETLWRLSKMYDVKISDIMHANKISKPTDLKIGARLLIPDAAPLRPVIPLFRSNKWKYILIHHSVTDSGNATSLMKIHLKRGFADLGYHFIIDNGTAGKGLGQIEAGRRWIKQQDGAHCKASGMNYKAIGICLVGNFSKDRVADEQLDALVYLVNTLRKYYNIPARNIIGHGQVSGARTECPGTKFPWNEFKRRLKN